MRRRSWTSLPCVSADEGTIAQGSAAAITVTVDVRPDFKLPEYVGIPTKTEPVDPTDAEIDSVVEGLRSEGADFKPTDRAAVKGDYIKLAYEGSVDGGKIADIAGDKQLYAKVPQTWEEVEGPNEGIIPGLGKHLAGVAKGDKRTVPVTFPANFQPVPALSGKTAEYALEILEVRERVLPELNAEFFKARRVDDLEGLRSQVRSSLKFQKEQKNRGTQRNQVTQALAERVNFEPPASLVESETQGVLRQFIEENMRRGIPAEQFEKDKNELLRGREEGGRQPGQGAADPRSEDRGGREDLRLGQGHRGLHPQRGGPLRTRGPTRWRRTSAGTARPSARCNSP